MLMLFLLFCVIPCYSEDLKSIVKRICLNVDFINEIEAQKFKTARDEKDLQLFKVNILEAQIAYYDTTEGARQQGTSKVATIYQGSLDKERVKTLLIN